MIGLVFDLVNGWIGDRLLDAPFSLRMALLVGGTVLNGAATAAYLGAHFGPGPRDGLMTGLVRRTGRSVRLVRTIIAGSVLQSGFLLGGTLGGSAERRVGTECVRKCRSRWWPHP